TGVQTCALPISRLHHSLIHFLFKRYHPAVSFYSFSFCHDFTPKLPTRQTIKYRFSIYIRSRSIAGIKSVQSIWFREIKSSVLNRSLKIFRKVRELRNSFRLLKKQPLLVPFCSG